MFDLPRNQGIANALKISEFLCPNLGWIQGQIIFTELSLRYLRNSESYKEVANG